MYIQISTCTFCAVADVRLHRRHTVYSVVDHGQWLFCADGPDVVDRCLARSAAGALRHAAFALGGMIGLIALMDNPFRGELSVSNAPYELIIELARHSRGVLPITRKNSRLKLDFV